MGRVLAVFTTDVYVQGRGEILQTSMLSPTSGRMDVAGR